MYGVTCIDLVSLAPLSGTHFEVGLGARPFNKSFAVAGLEFMLEEALADARVSLAIDANATAADLSADFCSLSGLASLRTFVSTIPWRPSGSFVVSSKLGTSLGSGIMPIISIENADMFDNSVTTAISVDFDLSDLQDLRNVIRNVLDEITQGVRKIIQGKMKLDGEDVFIGDGLATPDFTKLFDHFWTLFTNFKLIKEKVAGVVDSVLSTDVTNVVYANALYDALESSLPFYCAVVNALQAIDAEFLKQLKSDYFDLTDQCRNGATLDSVNAPSLWAQKVKFLLSALGFGAQNEAGKVSIIHDDAVKSVKLPQTLGNTPGVVNAANVFDKLRAVRFPTVRSLLAYLNDVAFEKSTTRGPFSLNAAFKNSVLKIVLGVDWSLTSKDTEDTSDMPMDLTDKMSSVSTLSPGSGSQTTPAFICSASSALCDAKNKVNYNNLQIHPRIQATITAVLDMNPFIDSDVQGGPAFTLEVNHAAFEIEASLRNINVVMKPAITGPGLSQCQQYNAGPQWECTGFALVDGHMYLLLGTEVHNVSIFDSTNTAVKTQTTVLAQLVNNAYGSFEIELPFRIGTATSALLITVGVSNDNVQNLGNTKVELFMEMTRGLVQQVRQKLKSLSDLGRTINAMEGLNHKLPLLGMSFNDLFVKGGAAGGITRQGWGDFLIWDTVLDKLMDDIPDCSINLSPPRPNTGNPSCKVMISDLIRRFKKHAMDLLDLPNLHMTGNSGGGKAALSVGVEKTVRVAFNPSWGEVFDNLPVKFKGAAALDILVTVKSGFDFTADYTGTTVSNIVFSPRPFEVSVQVDADIDLAAIFGIVEAAATGSLNMNMKYTKHGAVDAFTGAAGAYMELDASINGVSISDVLADKPRVEIDVPDISKPTEVSVHFSNFRRLRDFIQLTPENLLLMLRALDKFLQDYTNSTLFQTKLPMLDVTLKDVLDFTSGFEERISKRLQEPDAVKDRIKDALVVAGSAITLPYAANATSAMLIVMDDATVQFTPFDIDVTFSNAATLVSHLNTALAAAEAADRVVFQFNHNESCLELKTNPNTILTRLQLQSALTDEFLDTLLDPNFANLPLVDRDADEDNQLQIISELMMFFDDGVEDFFPTGPVFTTWQEFAEIVFEELGDLLGLDAIPAVTFERVAGRWELMFDLHIPFGFTQPAGLGLEYNSGTSAYLSAGIDADITLNMAPSKDSNYVRVAFGARLGAGESALSVTGRPPRPASGVAVDMTTFTIASPVSMDLVLTKDVLTGDQLEVNKTASITVPTGNFFSGFQTQLAGALASLGETGSVEMILDNEGYLVKIDNVRRMDIAIDLASKQMVGFGLTTTVTPFFEPIFKGLEFKARASLIAEVQSAHLTLGDMFDIRTENGRGEINLDLQAAIVNPLEGRRDQALSLNELRAYLWSGNNSLGDMLEASATVNGGISLTNIQVKLAGIPVDGWLEVDQDDITLSFDAGNRSTIKGDLTVTSSLDGFNLKGFGLCDILRLIEMAIELFDGDDAEPGGLLSSIGEWELPFMDVTVADLMSFIGDAIDMLQSVLDDPAGSLEKLNEAISTAINTDLVTVEFGLDASGTLVPGSQILTVTMSIGGGFAKHFGMSIDLEDLIGDAADSLKNIVDVGIAGSISFEADARATIKLGVALPNNAMTSCSSNTSASNNNSGVNLIVYDDTSLSLGCKASASGSINAQLGPIELGFAASMALGKSISDMDQAAHFHLKVAETQISSKNASFGKFAKDVFHSIEYSFDAAASQSRILTSLPFFSKCRKIWI